MAYLNQGVFAGSLFRRFWVIWMEGGGPPTFQHWSEESAVREAERLAVEHKGRRLFVLESVAMCEHKDVRWSQPSDVSSSDEVPF